MRARLSLLLAVAVVLAGCFHTDAVLTVHADGSATLDETVAVDGILGLGATQWLNEAGPPDVEGARRTAFEVEHTTGALVMRTRYAVDDVSALRYDLRDAGGVAEMMRGLASWSRGQEEIPPHAPTVLRFGFDAADGGAPAALRVTVPERTIRYADVARLPWHRDPQAEAFGVEGEITPEIQAQLDSLLAEMTPDERAAFDGYAAALPFQQDAEAVVLGGAASARFTVAVDGTVVSADGGRADGDAIVIADIDLAAITAATPDEEAAFDNAARAGFDQSGLFVPPPGPVTVRFR